MHDGSIRWFFIFFFYTLLSLKGNLGHLTWVRPQQSQKQHYSVLQVHAGSYHVSVIHWTLDMDYRIFYMPMWSFLCMSIHMGVGHTNNESAQHYWLRGVGVGKRKTQFLCVLLTGFKPWVFGSRVRHYQVRYPATSALPIHASFIELDPVSKVTVVFFDTVWISFLKHCTVVFGYLYIEICPLKPVFATLVKFHGHSSVRKGATETDIFLVSKFLSGVVFKPCVNVTC